MSAHPLVLVVDDDPDIRDSLQSALEHHGYGVIVAGNGKQALERTQLGGTSPAVVLLDLQMPVMDGEEFLVLQASEPLLAGVPVVVMTAQILEPAPAPPNVRAILKKPIGLGALVDLIQRICANP
jgi:CheY-like chemotaxis protein